MFNINNISISSLSAKDPINSLFSKLRGRSTYFENSSGTKNILNEFKNCG